MRIKENLAKSGLPQANAVVDGYRQRLQSDYGYPIEITRTDSRSGPGATSRSYWDQRTPLPHHWVEIAPCAPWLEPHKLAHELTHIALECEAHQAGRRKTHLLLEPTYRRLLSTIDPCLPDDESLLQKLFSLSLNVAVDLVVESRTKRDFPDLIPALFINLHKFEERNAREYPAIWQRTIASPELLQAMDALVAVRALFADSIAPSPLKHFDRFRGTPAGDLAEQLHADFQSAFSRGMAPGDHYDLADRWAVLLGLPGLHDWDPRPAFEVIKPAPSIGII